MYHVLYVKNCSSKIKSFKSEKKAWKFINKFKLVNHPDDNWVDLLFKGKMLGTSDSFPVKGAVRV